MGTPPIFLSGTQRERRVTSVISTEGLFKISSRRHAPRLSPIFCCVKTLRHAEGHGRGGGVGVQYFSFTVYFHSSFSLRVLSLSAGGLKCYFEYSFLTPPSLRATSPIFLRCKNTEEECRVTLRSLQCDTPHTGYGKGRSGIILNFRPALFPI